MRKSRPFTRTMLMIARKTPHRVRGGFIMATINGHTAPHRLPGTRPLIHNGRKPR